MQAETNHHQSMKNVIKLTAIVAISILSACNKNPKEETTTTTPEPAATKYANLEKASWFLGSWGNTLPDGALTEHWKKANDSLYLGESYFVTTKGDTVFAETVELTETAGKMAYTVTVPDQNDAKPVRFEMTSITDKQVVFENPAHDYPNKIVYNKTAEDSLAAEISGLKKGKPASEQFRMTRQK